MRMLPIAEVFEIDPNEIKLNLSLIDKDTRIHNDFKDEMLRKSIEYFGITSPVVASINAANQLTIIDGYRRFVFGKLNNVKIPVILKNMSSDDAITLRIAMNFSQRQMSIREMKKLIGMVKKASVLREIGLSTQYIYAVKNAPSEIVEKISEKVPEEVAMEVMKVALIDKKKAEELAVLVKREDAKTKEDVKKLRESMEEMKSGINCALCAKRLTAEEKNWMAVCSPCKWVLLEEYKETAYDRTIKDWITGKKIYKDEAIVVSKEELLKILLRIPEDIRLSTGIEGLCARLRGYESEMECSEREERVGEAIKV